MSLSFSTGGGGGGGGGWCAGWWGGVGEGRRCVCVCLWFVVVLCCQVESVAGAAHLPNDYASVLR